MSIDDLSSAPLTNEELKYLRQMKLEDERARWVRGQAKVWLTWIIGAPVAAWASWDALSKLIHGIWK